MSAKIRVMLVDDSAIVRGMVQRALRAEPDIEIVGTAVNGQLALEQLAKTPADVIVLDIEMPVMDGLTALPQIMKLAPYVRVIMSSTLTLHNAEISLKAMTLGAADYVAKPTAVDPNGTEGFFRELIAKIKALAPRAPAAISSQSVSAPAKRPTPTLVPASTAPIQALAIASSTGGPQALMQIFEALKGRSFKVPVFITQHMPASFTAILATHLRNSSGNDCHEAKDGEEVKPGIIYIAPGDFHLTAERQAGIVRLHLDQNEPENFCRPSADPMFRSLARVYGTALLAVVLTGLGADGAKGAREVSAARGTVIAQDEASSVVYGMPRAAAETGILSAVLPLTQFAPHFIKVGLV
ncbi:MAG: chemotaxis response regulator protein-glutamate methylesterase [Rickettsiales bacterium]